MEKKIKKTKKNPENGKSRYDVISPDGFTIDCKGGYSSEAKAKKALSEWIDGYRVQGYYSSVRFGRIPLYHLEKACQIVKVK